VNDVVLATVAGAVGRYLERRRPPPQRPAELRVAVPVNIREQSERGELGNRASVWLLALPIDGGGAMRRLEIVRDMTARLKASGQKDGAELLAQAAEWVTGNVVHLAVRLLASASPYNLIVTNIPGPPVPFYLLGARMVAAYPHLPLFEGQGLGVALFSYVGRLYWGLTGDWDLVPDVDDFVEDLSAAFDELRRLARGAAAPRAARAAGTGIGAAGEGAEPAADQSSACSTDSALDTLRPPAGSSNNDFTLPSVTTMA
jgi:WS/DGAT/MGAT family acyltransferase